MRMILGKSENVSNSGKNITYYNLSTEDPGHSSVKSYLSRVFFYLNGGFLVSEAEAEIYKLLHQIQGLVSEESKDRKKLELEISALKKREPVRVPIKITNKVSLKEIIFKWESILDAEDLSAGEKVHKFGAFMREKKLTKQEMV